MKILHLETATDICSVAISTETELLSLKETNEPFIHSRKITILIHEALKESNLRLADLNAIALSRGPGSYTGLRVGASTAKGICYALNKPLIAVDTLMALANTAIKKHKNSQALYCSMIDARRKEVYMALYNESKEVIEDVQNKILDENSFRNYFEEGQEIIFTGNGSKKASSIFNSSKAIFFEGECSAETLIEIAVEAYKEKRFVDPVYFEPLYYKTPNITTPKKLL